MPQVIRLDDGRTFTVDDANAPALQSAVRELAARADAADKTAAAEKKAHGDAIAKSTARTDSLIKHINAKGTALKARLDAMKARMIGCDECSGSGKVMDDADKEGACEYCGGSGKVRMHDAIKTLPADGEAANLDDDLAELDDAAAELAEMDDPESAEEQEVATAANSERKDAAKKQRAAARRDSRVKLAASFARRIDRRAAQRAMLLSVASKHVDAADLAGKSDVDIKRAVLTKIAPHLDTVNLDASAVPVLYAAELARAAKQDGAQVIVNQSDALRAGMSQGGPAGARQDANPSAAEIAKKRDDGMANAWRTPAAK